MFHLNPLGSKILDLMDKGHSPNEIAHKLSAEFAVSLDLVQADISEFLDALREHELLDSSERTA